MPSINEEKVTMLAPNASAITNAKKISKTNGFIELCRSEDDTLLFGSCSGSGSHPYHTSVDFTNADELIFRCSCPSRQLPCKHGLALLFDYLAGKPFAVAAVPDDVAQKREKLTAKKETVKSDAPKKVNKAAAAKKQKKQLEGLALAQQFVKEVLRTGLSAMGANSVKTYKNLAKQLGDYYLPGPQALVNTLLIELDTINREPAMEEICHIRMISILEQLSAIVKKGQAFLSEQTEAGTMEDSTMYDHIGYIWQLSQLKELGLYKENRQLVQLSFQVDFDEARDEYVDKGWWVDLETGEISKTENLRPLKALKHIKQEDTVFDCLLVPCLYYYPGEKNKRVRYEQFTTRAVTSEDLAAICGYAEQDFGTVVKAAKNQIKNVLSEKTLVCLLAFDKIGTIDGQTVLTDKQGVAIALECPDQTDNSVEHLRYLPDQSLLHQQVLLGEVFYQPVTRRVAVTPLSIISEQQIIRLFY